MPTIMLTRPAVFAAIVEREPVHVVLVPHFEGVKVPPLYAHANELHLKFSPRFNTVLEVTADYVAQRLSFQGAPFDVVVPWDAMIAMSSQAVSVLFWTREEPKQEQKPQPLSSRLRLVVDNEVDVDVNNNKEPPDGDPEDGRNRNA